MALQRTAPDRLAVQRGHDEKTLGRREVRGGKRNAERGIEAGLEARGELLEVAPETGPGAPAPRILHVDADRTREQQPLHDSHGRARQVSTPSIRFRRSYPQTRDGVAFHTPLATLLSTPHS